MFLPGGKPEVQYSCHREGTPLRACNYGQKALTQRQKDEQGKDEASGEDEAPALPIGTLDEFMTVAGAISKADCPSYLFELIGLDLKNKKKGVLGKMTKVLELLSEYRRLLGLLPPPGSSQLYSGTLCSLSNVVQGLSPPLGTMPHPLLGPLLRASAVVMPLLPPKGQTSKTRPHRAKPPLFCANLLPLGPSTLHLRF